MKITGKYCMVIRGDLAVANSRSTITAALPYLLDRLFNGLEVAPEALEAFGIEVQVEDQPWE